MTLPQPTERARGAGRHYREEQQVHYQEFTSSTPGGQPAGPARALFAPPWSIAC